MIWAIILAAGRSRRMGTQKMLLPFGETTIVGAVVRTALASRAAGTLVVVGADGEAVRRDVEPKGVACAVNANYAQGMLTSVQTGLRALPAGVEAAVIMLGDQPFLAPAVVDQIIAAYEESRRGIVMPAFRGRCGHPVVIDLKFRDEVLAIEPLDGLRRLIQDHPEEILVVEVGDANILRDLDTPEDYRDGVKPTPF